MRIYDWVTSEMFSEKLAEIIDREPASALFAVPGIAELLMEHFNNEVLEELEAERLAESDNPPRDPGEDNIRYAVGNSVYPLGS